MTLLGMMVGCVLSVLVVFIIDPSSILPVLISIALAVSAVVIVEARK